MRPTPERGRRLSRERVHDGQGYFIDAINISESEDADIIGRGDGAGVARCNCGEACGAHRSVGGRWADFDDDRECIACASQWGSKPYTLGAPKADVSDPKTIFLVSRSGDARADAPDSASAESSISRIPSRASEGRAKPLHDGAVASRMHVEPRLIARRAGSDWRSLHRHPIGSDGDIPTGKLVSGFVRRDSARVCDPISSDSVASSWRRRRRRSARWRSTRVHVNI